VGRGYDVYAKRPSAGMILVDTTVWIDFFAGKSVPHVTILEQAIMEKKDICICGLVLMEILQGIRNDRQYLIVKKYMRNLVFLPIAYGTFIKAADIYRDLRKQGITIRNSIDCLIAAVSIEQRIPLLHNDRDFDNIERECGLVVIKAIQ
jgi:predicted nucleic acid-binding protein